MIGSLVLVCIIGYVVGDRQMTLARPITKRGIPWITDGFGDGFGGFEGNAGSGWQLGGGGSFGSPWSL